MTMYPLDPGEAQAATREGVAAEQGRRDHYAGQPEGDLREAASTQQPYMPEDPGEPPEAPEGPEPGGVT